MGYEADVRNRYGDVDENKRVAREERIAEGKLTGEDFDAAVSQSSKEFYESLAQQMVTAREEFSAFDSSVDEKFGKMAPRLAELRSAIEDCEQLISKLLKEKGKVTAIYDRLREQGYTGSYASVLRLARQIDPKPVKAIVVGGNAVMLGSMLAGLEEAPGEVMLYEGRRFKEYRGMGSLGAMKGYGKDRYGTGQGGNGKLVPEGIEGRVPYKGSLGEYVYQLVGGLRSGMGYAGAASLEDLRTKTRLLASPTRVSSKAIRTMLSLRRRR